METIGNLKVAKNEADRTYRIEQLPGLVAIVNLDYSSQEDREIILEILKNNPLGKSFSMSDLLSKISIVKDNKGQRFFTKGKRGFIDPVSKELISWVKNSSNLNVLDNFQDKKARYALAGVLNEIILSKKIKKIIASNAVQELVKKHNFAGIKFSEPIFALIHKEQRRKYLVYKNLKSENVFLDSSEDVFWEGYNSTELIDDLRKIFFKNGINPNDLNERQFIITEQEGKPSLVLIDTEAYTKVDES